MQCVRRGKGVPESPTHLLLLVQSLSNRNRIYNTTRPYTFCSMLQAGYDIGVAGGLFSKKSFLARFYPDFQASQGA